MSRFPEEYESDPALRQGLRSLPVPEPSSDFDARVHAALRRPEPWRLRFWKTARPMLAATACSLVLTLTLLQRFTGASTSSWSQAASPSAEALALERGKTPLEALDRNVETMDIPNTLFGGFWALRRPHATKASSPPRPLLRPGAPGRRSQLFTPPLA